jgi:hypothetical protein
MFCVNCGSSMEGNALAACASCGKDNQPMISGAEVGRMIKEASSDALSAVRHVAADPIAGLASSFAMLGERRGRAAGIAFGVGFALTAALASLIVASNLGSESNAKLMLAAFIVGLVPFIAFAATSTGARKAFRTTGTTGADLFTAGVALQPVGLFLILAAVLGLGNYQAVLLLGLFALTYSLCILFAGCTRLVKVPERFAPPVLAVMLLAAMWLTKIVGAAFLDDGPLGRLFR